MLKVYGSDIYKKFVNNTIKKYTVEPVEKFEIIKNGIIANEHEHGFGVFDDKYRFIKSSSQCHRGRRGQFVPKFNHDNIPYVDADVLYLCHLGKMAFGHFLIEHLNRAWLLLNKKYANLKVVIVNEYGVEKIPDYMYDFVEFLGVKHDDIIVLNKTTRFRNVYIPYSCFDVKFFISDIFGKIYEKMSKNVPSNKVKYDRIYVSRAKMPNDRKTWGEEKIQNIFKKNGYHIIYPETLSLKQQIAYVKDCKYLAGCAGTALHLALFMKSGGTVIQIKRNSIPNSDNIRVQYLLNQVRKLNTIVAPASVEQKATEHWSTIPQLIGVTDYMKQFFDDNKFKYTDKDICLEKSDIQNYERELSKHDFKPRFGNYLKRQLIHYSSCFIIGRENRGNYRKWLAKVIKYNRFN